MVRHDAARWCAVTLRDVVGLVSPHLGVAARRMWLAEPAREIYLDWLGVSYDLVRATAPLLAEALTACVRLGEGELASYFAGQLTDEFGHDRWIEEDWVATGGDPIVLTARVPHPAAARLAGSQYYWIRHAHPVALAGHIAVLEWHPPRPDLVGELIRRTGWPASAFRTIARHAELDVTHGRRLDKLLAQAPLTEFQQRLVTTSAMTTALGLVELMSELGHHDRTGRTS
jgi:Iron-containing redox enzyme